MHPTSLARLVARHQVRIAYTHTVMQMTEHQRLQETDLDELPGYAHPPRRRSGSCPEATMLPALLRLSPAPVISALRMSPDTAPAAHFVVVNNDDGQRHQQHAAHGTMQHAASSLTCRIDASPRGSDDGLDCNLVTRERPLVQSAGNITSASSLLLAELTYARAEPFMRASCASLSNVEQETSTDLLQPQQSSTNATPKNCAVLEVPLLPRHGRLSLPCHQFRIDIESPEASMRPDVPNAPAADSDTMTATALFFGNDSRSVSISPHRPRSRCIDSEQFSPRSPVFMGPGSPRAQPLSGAMRNPDCPFGRSASTPHATPACAVATSNVMLQPPSLASHVHRSPSPSLATPIDAVTLEAVLGQQTRLTSV